MTYVRAGSFARRVEHVFVGEQVDVVTSAIAALLHKTAERTLTIAALSLDHDLDAALDLVVLGCVVTAFGDAFANYSNVGWISLERRRNTLVRWNFSFVLFLSDKDDDGDVVLILDPNSFLSESYAHHAGELGTVFARAGIRVAKIVRIRFHVCPVFYLLAH